MEDKKKLQSRLRMQKMRNKQRNIDGKDVTQTPDSVTSEGSVTRDGVVLPRFVTLSDGQVLDRAKPPQSLPQSGGFIARMKAANKSDATILRIRSATC